jgi:formylmethanofuran dehydrogenase subunit B
VDPRRTSSAEWADGWLGLDVGSDIALDALTNGVANDTPQVDAAWSESLGAFVALYTR